MDKKIVFLDIDGTLISGLTAPSERTVEAVRSARAKGHKILLRSEEHTSELQSQR